MNTNLLAIAALGFAGAATLASAGPPPGGGRHMRPPGVYPGPAYRPYYPAYRPYYPAYRPIYPAWRGGYGYWGPGVVVGAAWPQAWGATYAPLPYVLPPLVVNTVPAPQLMVQPAVPAEAPASSYWYYCTEPAGYFPYVQQCSQPWMKVVPQLPGSSTEPPRLAP